jgi:hypothetical protein
LQRQPRWAWFTAWGDLAGGRNDRAAVTALVASPQVMNWDKLPWVKVTKPTVHYPVIK